MKLQKGLLVCLCLVALVALGGCGSKHTLVMKDGRTIETRDRPEFDPETGFYEYTDMEGKTVKVNKDEVVEYKEK